MQDAYEGLSKARLAGPYLGRELQQRAPCRSRVQREQSVFELELEHRAFACLSIHGAINQMLVIDAYPTGRCNTSTGQPDRGKIKPAAQAVTREGAGSNPRKLFRR